MTKEFILKRIEEQEVYIQQINESHLSLTRKAEIIASATGQLEYFKEQLQKWEEQK
jgi:predicted HTH domain antitoxin